MSITTQQLLQILPNAGAKAGVFVSVLATAMQRYAIVGRQREAAFIAQAGHESSQLRQVLESLSYRADRIVDLGNAAKPGTRWRSRVPRVAELASNSIRLGNALYGGRLGNGPESSGDGYKFRGRGLIQITGRSNYSACSQALFGDDRLVKQPELLEQPQYAALSAAWFWATNGLNTLADASDFTAITTKINGGQTGASDGKALYDAALAVLA